jgi:PAS domain S-box-containing protein
VWDLFPEAVGTEAYFKCRQAMAERLPLYFEAFFPAINRWYENHVYPTKEGLSIYWREITERKRAEAELRRSEAYLAEGQRLTRTGSWGWNVSTGEVFWSEEQFRIFGFDPKGLPPSLSMALELIHPDDRPAVQQALDKAVRETGDYEWDCRIVASDGTIKHVHATAHPVLESGKLVEYIGTTMDVTERKHSEEALRRAQAELTHAARVSSMGALTASIAHEISQPLAALVSNGDACRRWLERAVPDLGEARKAVERMANNAVRASDVIKGIRSLVRKSAPGMDPLDINEVIQEVIALTVSDLNEKGVVLQTELQPDIPPVLGDRVQLQQVLLNLILNGSEAMSAVDWPVRELVIRSQESKAAGVMVAVRDSGTGLDPQHSERIFDPFFSTKEGSLGLGLAISRTIIEAHQGRLWATRNDDRGATFHFTVPAIR